MTKIERHRIHTKTLMGTDAARIEPDSNLFSYPLSWYSPQNALGESRPDGRLIGHSQINGDIIAGCLILQITVVHGMIACRPFPDATGLRIPGGGSFLIA